MTDPRGGWQTGARSRSLIDKSLLTRHSDNTANSRWFERITNNGWSTSATSDVSSKYSSGNCQINWQIENVWKAWQSSPYSESWETHSLCIYICTGYSIWSFTRNYFLNYLLFRYIFQIKPAFSKGICCDSYKGRLQGKSTSNVFYFLQQSSSKIQCAVNQSYLCVSLFDLETKHVYVDFLIS